MNGQDPYALHSVVVVAAILCYYAVVVAWLGGHWSRWALRAVTEHAGFAGHFRTDEIDKTIRLSTAAVMQLLFGLGLAIVGGARLDALLFAHVQPLRLAYAVPLGVGEAAVGSFLGELTMRGAMLVAPGRVSQEPRDWLAMLKGGWMSLFLRTAVSAPLGLVLVLTLLYVGGEEVVFRGVLITHFQRLGAPVAFAIALGLFTTVQAFHMPSLEAALFPMVGAVVIGAVHGALYLAVPDLLPLIVAHFVFLLAALL